MTTDIEMSLSTKYGLARIEGAVMAKRLSNGSIFSPRSMLTATKWKAECDAVSRALGIPPEQNPALFYATEYLARPIEYPHGGLLGERMIYWLLKEFRPAQKVATGTLVATLYFETPEDGAHHIEPITLHLEGYDATYLAWQDIAMEPKERTREEWAWESAARIRLSKWSTLVMRKVHSLEANQTIRED